MDAPDDRPGVMSRYRRGPGLLEEVVTGLQDALLDAVPSGGGWTIREIVNTAKLTARKAYGFRSYTCLEVALYHTLGNLPEPTTTHRFY